MQLLQLESGERIKVIRTFHDSGRPARMGLVGGQTIQLDAGTPPRPEIRQGETGFYYADMRPVNNPEHVQHLEEPYRTEALAFIAKGVAKPMPVVRASKKVAAKPPRGRRPEPERITDEDSLRRITGGVTVKTQGED